MRTKIRIPKTVNPDLAKERENASFDSNEFATWFYGGADKFELKRLIEKELFDDLDFDPAELEYLTYEESYTETIKQTIAAIQKLSQLQERLNPGGNDIYPELMLGIIGETLMPLGSPLIVHVAMFIRALKNQGDAEIYEKYGKRAERCEIIGTYCQTELGHGTFLRGLETTAHYDRNTDEFILNTPTLSSYKWWPSGLGHTTTHCIVVAQLFIDNEAKGIQLFLVQLRDEETFVTLPGIEVGEIGKKLAYHGVDNGYLGLQNVRIPRKNMLMKNSKVLPGGVFVQGPIDKFNYFPMLIVRCNIVFNNSILLAQAVTIATRYSAVRRQSPINPDEPEPQIMDHLTQQLKIFPDIALAVAYHLAAKKLFELYNETTKLIAELELSRLPELHTLICTFKALCSYDTTAGVERCRFACGGHGYLAAANLGKLYTSASPACTYEGENSVLFIQAGKNLLKSWKNMLDGKKLMPSLAYLLEFRNQKSFFKWTGSTYCILKALEFTTTKKIELAYNHYKMRMDSGQTEAVAINNTAIEMTQAAELYGRTFLTRIFLEEVNEPNVRKHSLQFQKMLENLFELYLMHTIFRHMDQLLRFIPMSEQDISTLQLRLEQALGKIRPDAVAIVDGFDFTDRTLRSVLGAYDGNVYERIFESTQKSPLNKQSIPKAVELYLKPFMASKL